MALCFIPLYQLNQLNAKPSDITLLCKLKALFNTDHPQGSDCTFSQVWKSHENLLVMC